MAGGHRDWCGRGEGMGARRGKELWGEGGGEKNWGASERGGAPIGSVAAMDAARGCGCGLFRSALGELLLRRRAFTGGARRQLKYKYQFFRPLLKLNYIGENQWRLIGEAKGWAKPTGALVRFRNLRYDIHAVRALAKLVVARGSGRCDFGRRARIALSLIFFGMPLLGSND